MKRGQSAMEFLMTYGWAILVVLIAVGTLAYFGVLNPGAQVPETCIFFPGINCEDYKVDSDSVVLVILNGGGTDFENVYFTVVDTGACSGDSSNVEELRDGEKKTFTINCTEKLEKNALFRKEVRISYTEVNGLSHNRIGQLHTKVE